MPNETNVALCVSGFSGVSDDEVFSYAEKMVRLSDGQPSTKPPRKSLNQEQSTLDDAERGQGVGAEDDRCHYQVPRANTSALRRTQHGTGVHSYPSSTFCSSVYSLERTGYVFTEEVPTDVRHLSVEQVLRCLRWLNLHRHVEKFRTEQVDGELLMSIDQQILIEEFRFKRFDAMKLYMFAQRGWRPKFVRASLNPQRRQQHQHQFYLQLVDSYSESYA